jgi:hypothetical protein
MKRLLPLAVLALLCSSCAFMSRRNRPLMNACENALWPESTSAKVAVSPVVLPVCLTAGVVDTVLVHPVTVLDDAWYDTNAALWQPTDRGYVTECALFPFRAGLTPPVWALHFTSRCLFLAPPWPPPPDELTEDLADPDRAMRLLVARDLSLLSYKDEAVGPATEAMLKACRAFPDDTELCAALIDRLPAPLTEDARAYLGSVARNAKGAIAGHAVRRLFLECLGRPGRAYEGSAGKARELAAADRLARVYDDVVKAGHHRTEIYIASLAAKNTPWPGPRALGLYIVRSLQRRGWPDYAEAVSFRIQSRLLRVSDAARIDAVFYEWRALRLRHDWPLEVARAIRRLQDPKAPKGIPKALLLEQQVRYEKQLQTIGAGEAVKLLRLTEQLMSNKTLLDAQELAERLLKAPKADRELFLSTLYDMPEVERADLER